jgi:hypothetical protein
VSASQDKPLTARENALFQPLARRLFELVVATDQVLDLLTRPLAGSPQALSQRAFRNDRYDDAYLRIHALAFSALDGLRTIGMIIRGGSLPSFSLYTVLRGTAEATLRCHHLVDPTISESSRLARGLNERYDNIAEVRLFRRTDVEEGTSETTSGQRDQALWSAKPAERASRLSKSEREELNKKLTAIDDERDERVAHLANRARSKGIDPKTTPRGEVVGFEQAPKSDFELFSAYIRRGGTYYRLISGLAHSMQWAQHLRQERRPTSVSGGVIGTELQLEIFCPMLAAVLELHDNNISDWLLLAGHGADQWEEAKARARM